MKRFFCHEFNVLGYRVAVDPMFTDKWNEQSKADFFRFIEAKPSDVTTPVPRDTILFVDPDTGIKEKGGSRHVSFDRLVDEASRYTLVFSFDQSFSRGVAPREIMKNKIAELRKRECYAMYYDSHARFLFASLKQQPLRELRAHLLALGLPSERLL